MATPTEAVAGAARRILITGAGLAGAAMAHALLADGHEVVIIERDNDLNRSGAGLFLTGNAINALTQLGLVDRVPAIARQINETSYCDPNGSILARASCEQADWPCFYGVAHATLRRRLAEDLPIRFASQVTALRQDGTVEVDFSDGETHVFDLVIGADGVHSQTRQLLLGDTPAANLERFSGYRFLVENTSGITAHHTFLGNGRTFLVVPLADNQLYCGAGPIDASCLKAGDTPADTVKQTFKDFPGVAACLDAIRAETRFIPSQFWNLELPTWHAGAVVLIGDAAHAQPPTLSQGGAMAFEDVQTLRTCLSRYGNLADALKIYESTRRKRIAPLQQAALQRISVNEASPVDNARHLHLAAKMGASHTEDIWRQLIEQDPNRS